MITVVDPSRDGTQASVPTRITLYDLIEAINEEVEPGEEDLVVAVVRHLFETGQVRFSSSFDHVN